MRSILYQSKCSNFYINLSLLDMYVAGYYFHEIQSQFKVLSAKHSVKILLSSLSNIIIKMIQQLTKHANKLIDYGFQAFILLLSNNSN